MGWFSKATRAFGDDVLQALYGKLRAGSPEVADAIKAMGDADIKAFAMLDGFSGGPAKAAREHLMTSFADRAVSAAARNAAGNATPW